jgi:hypothetical protein
MLYNIYFYLIQPCEELFQAEMNSVILQLKQIVYYDEKSKID